MFVLDSLLLYYHTNSSTHYLIYIYNIYIYNIHIYIIYIYIKYVYIYIYDHENNMAPQSDFGEGNALGRTMYVTYYWYQ